MRQADADVWRSRAYRSLLSMDIFSFDALDPRERYLCSWGSIIGAGISAIGSLIGGSQANSANAEQAQLNRDFQEEMSSTAYQRSMADMRAAGLNPILAYQKGGASTPGGSMATMQDVIGPAVDRAMTGVSTAMQYKRNEAEIEKINADTEVAKAQAANVQAQTDNYRASTSKTLDDITSNFQNRSESLSRMQSQEVDRFVQRLRGENISVDTGNRRIENLMLEQALQSAKAAAASGRVQEEFRNTPLGRLILLLGTAGKDLNPFLSGAGTAQQIYRRSRDE